MFFSTIRRRWMPLATLLALWTPPQLASAVGPDLSDPISRAVQSIERMRTGASTGTPPPAPVTRKDSPASSLFGDGFEDVFIEPPLLGDLTMTQMPYASPEPSGTQLESLSETAFATGGFRFLQSDTGLLGRVSPEPEAFRRRLDFDRLSYSPGGTVEASLVPVDLSLGSPQDSTSGCESSDFSSFPPGSIALIQRGTCSFTQKASNAEAAGAVGVIIFNQGTAGRTGVFSGTLSAEHRGVAPVATATFALGQAWAGQSGAVFRIRVSAGQRNNAWELVPVIHPNALPGTHWIRNSVTGQLLTNRGALLVNGVPKAEVLLDDALPDDRRAWWIVSGSEVATLRNGSDNLAMAAVMIGGTPRILTISDIDRSVLCPNNDSCTSWRLNEPFSRAPSGRTRLRSSFGDVYLHQAGDALSVGRVKPGWPTGQWILEPVPFSPYRRILNLQTGKYLHVENGVLEAGDIENGWWSAMWEMEVATQVGETNRPGTYDTASLPSPIAAPEGSVRFRNRWTGQLIVNAGGVPATADSASDALQSVWVIDDEPIPTIPDANLLTAINELLGRAPGAEILSSEAAGIYALSRQNAGIANLSGLEHLINLRDLRLAGNFITNVAPLANLSELGHLDLSRNAIASIAPLEGNLDLSNGDRVILLRNILWNAAPSDGAPLLARAAIAVPSPGLLVLHDVATNLVIDASIGSSGQLVDAGVATNHALWSISFDVAQQRFRIRLNSYHDARAGYLTWDDQQNKLTLGGVSLDPEWDFEFVGDGQYRIRNTRASGPNGYLQICGNDLDVAQDNVACSVATWHIDAPFVQQAKDRANAGYYNPRFAAPDGGHTRIQNTDSRLFLALGSGALQLAQVAESDLAAQWKLIPVGFDRTYFWAIRNRQNPSTYLYRDADNQLKAGGLPAGPPDGALWALDPANQPFLFAFDRDSNLETFARPLLAGDRFMAPATPSSTTVEFAAAPSTRTVWRMDGGIKTPAANQATGFIMLQRAADAIFDVDFSLSWRQPNAAGVLSVQNRTGSGTFVMPPDAQDIRAKAVCVACGLGFSDQVIFDITYARPPNRCLEARGKFYAPYHGVCDPDQGSMAVFAVEAAEQVFCEIAALVEYVPSALDQLGVDDLAEDLVAGDLERAQERLFSQSNLAPPDFTQCGNPYESMSFEAGAAAGAFSLSVGGGIGVVWGLSAETAGALSFTATGGSADSALRLVGASTSLSLGLWKDKPTDTAGRSLGLSLQGNKDVPIDLRKLKSLKKVGLSAGLTLWFECGTGTGRVINSVGCELREDSRFEGFTFDFSAGVDISLPLPGAVAVTYSKTCIPANFSGNDCPD